ncbi:hypothetical protein NP0149_02670 [Helicobacter pylori]
MLWLKKEHERMFNFLQTITHRAHKIASVLNGLSEIGVVTACKKPHLITLMHRDLIAIKHQH